MNTQLGVATEAPVRPRLVRAPADRRFFMTMVVAIAVIVFVGFAPTFYLRPASAASVRAGPSPNRRGSSEAASAQCRSSTREAAATEPVGARGSCGPRVEDLPPQLLGFDCRSAFARDRRAQALVREWHQPRVLGARQAELGQKRPPASVPHVVAAILRHDCRGAAQDRAERAEGLLAERRTGRPACTTTPANRSSSLDPR